MITGWVTTRVQGTRRGYGSDAGTSIGLKRTQDLQSPQGVEDQKGRSVACCMAPCLEPWHAVWLRVWPRTSLTTWRWSAPQCRRPFLFGSTHTHTQSHERNQSWIPTDVKGLDQDATDQGLPSSWTRPSLLDHASSTPSRVVYGGRRCATQIGGLGRLRSLSMRLMSVHLAYDQVGLRLISHELRHLPARVFEIPSVSKPRFRLKVLGGYHLEEPSRIVHDYVPVLSVSLGRHRGV